jgi:hypothetical protein
LICVVAVVVLAVLGGCGEDDATVASSETTSTTAAESVVGIEFGDLPPDYAVVAESSAVQMFSVGGGEDPGKPSVQAGVRRSSPPEYPVDVSVFAGRADLFAGFADDAERSELRDGAAVVNRLEEMTIVLWKESGALVWLSAPAAIPADDLTQIVESVRLTTE